MKAVRRSAMAGVDFRPSIPGARASERYDSRDMNSIDQTVSAGRLVKATSSERRAWAAVVVVATVGAIAGFAPVPTMIIGIAGLLVAPLAAWAWLGADDRLIKLRDEVEASKTTGAGDLWAGK